MPTVLADAGNVETRVLLSEAPRVRDELAVLQGPLRGVRNVEGVTDDEPLLIDVTWQAVEIRNVGGAVDNPLDPCLKDVRHAPFSHDEQVSPEEVVGDGRQRRL